MAAPRVFSYLDYRAFLADWISWKRAQDPTYSYASFAKDGKCSKSAIANVIGGARTARPKTLDSFAKAMDLKPPERNFLGLLVDLDTARDQGVRRLILDRILSSASFGRVRVAEDGPEEAALRYLERWYIPVIRELAALPGFRPEPEWIASVLRPRISPGQAKAALDTLVDLDFVRIRPDGCAEVREVRFRTHDETMHAAAEHWHRQEVRWLLEHYDPRDADGRHLQGAVLTISSAQLPEFKARLTGLVEQLATLADDASTEGPRGVFQLAIQLLPVTEEVHE